MESKPNKFTTLSNDIRHIITNAYSEKLEMIRLCKDHHNFLPHQDKKPILNISQDDLVGVFDLNSNHYFLSASQVCRLGVYCKLDFPNLIALMLKAEWEEFLSEISGYSVKKSLTLESILCNKVFIEKYIPDFKPDGGKFFEYIRYNLFDSNLEITYSNIDFFIRELLEGNKFLFENEQISKIYPDNDITEKMLLCKITEQQRETYIRLKELWLLKSTELEDLLMNFERKKRLNLNIENKYFQTFGKMEIEGSGIKGRVLKYQTILDIMREHPDLTFRELIKLAEEKLIEAENEKMELKNKMIRSSNFINELIANGTITPVDNEFRHSYMQSCKKLLKKLYFLLHSDTCPNYNSLSKQKRTEVNKMWLRLMKSTKNELYSFSPSMLLYSLPDYGQLESIYKRVCEILGINPDDFEMGNRLEFMIRKGVTIKRIMEFLKNETELMELQLSHLELVKDEYTNDGQAQIYRDALIDINGHSGKLKNEIDELKNHVFKLKRQISKGLLKITI
jgi:hypothetical protein